MNRLFNKTKNMAVRTFGLCLMLIAAVSFSSCSSDNDPFFTATEDDAPRFLNSDLPKVDDNNKLGSFGTILRTNNFKFGVIATPVDYTTITWYIDDELVYTGDTIDQKVLAGDHIVKVVATTTKGLSCYRLGKLSVTPLDSDPQLGNEARERWVAPGAATTIKGCKNLGSITNVYVGSQEVAFSINNDKLTMTIPASLAEGTYHISLEDAAGVKYGGNQIKITNEEYPDKSVKLWEGHWLIDWGAADGTSEKKFTGVTEDQVKTFSAGQVIRVYYSIAENADYSKLGIKSGWWSELDGCPEVEVTASGYYEVTLSADALSVMNEKNGMIVVGHGVYVDKVTIE